MAWQPVPKNISLCCWRLVYHVPIDIPLTREHEISATTHCKLKLSTWDESKILYPKALEKVLDKRKRRLAYHQEFGSCPDCWTPNTKHYHYPIHVHVKRSSETLRLIKYLFRLNKALISIPTSSRT